MTDSSVKSLRLRLLNTASVVSLHKVAQVAGSLATVVLVPRLLGVEDYGRFAFVLSLSYLGQILGDFGTLDMFGRHVPGMPEADARRLYMRTLAFKLPVSVLCGLATAIAALLLADWMRPEWALLAGLGVALHIVAWVPFQFALGRNRVGAWMTEQSWRQWVTLAALLLLYPWLGLGGALLALVIMEASFCALGLWWARQSWEVAELRWDRSYYGPFVRFGLGFFLANLTAVALYRSGPVLVELLTGETAQAGYVDLAVGLFLMVYVTISQFALSLVPSLGELRAAGENQQSRRWLGSFMRVGLALATLGTLAIWLLADWAAPLVFGPEFAAVAPAMRWISLGIPLAVLAWAGNITATVTGRGGVKFSAAATSLAAYLAITLWLAPSWGAAGVALALSVAILVHVLVLATRLRPDFDLGAILASGQDKR